MMVAGWPVGCWAHGSQPAVSKVCGLHCQWFLSRRGTISHCKILHVRSTCSLPYSSFNLPHTCSRTFNNRALLHPPRLSRHPRTPLSGPHFLTRMLATPTPHPRQINSSTPFFSLLTFVRFCPYGPV